MIGRAGGLIITRAVPVCPEQGAGSAVYRATWIRLVVHARVPAELNTRKSGTSFFSFYLQKPETTKIFNKTCIAIGSKVSNINI